MIFLLSAVVSFFASLFHIHVCVCRTNHCKSDEIWLIRSLYMCNTHKMLLYQLYHHSHEHNTYTHTDKHRNKTKQNVAFHFYFSLLHRKKFKHCSFFVRQRSFYLYCRVLPFPLRHIQIDTMWYDRMMNKIAFDIGNFSKLCLIFAFSHHYPEYRIADWSIWSRLRGEWVYFGNLCYFFFFLFCLSFSSHLSYMCMRVCDEIGSCLFLRF